MAKQVKNLSKSEKRALQDLQKDRNFIIQGADKGGAVCIMDKDVKAKLVGLRVKLSKTALQLLIYWRKRECIGLDRKVGMDACFKYF